MLQLVTCGDQDNTTWTKFMAEPDKPAIPEQRCSNLLVLIRGNTHNSTTPPIADFIYMRWNQTGCSSELIFTTIYVSVYTCTDIVCTVYATLFLLGHVSTWHDLLHSQSSCPSSRWVWGCDWVPVVHSRDLCGCGYMGRRKFATKSEHTGIERCPVE